MLEMTGIIGDRRKAISALSPKSPIATLPFVIPNGAQRNEESHKLKSDTKQIFCTL
jgi:hypothetical protein